MDQLEAFHFVWFFICIVVGIAIGSWLEGDIDEVD